MKEYLASTTAVPHKVESPPGVLSWIVCWMVRRVVFYRWVTMERSEAINSTLLLRLGFSRGALEGKSVELILSMGGRIFYQTHFFPMVKLRGSAREIFLLLKTQSGEHVGVLLNADRRERDGVMVTDCIFIEVEERKKFEDALLRAKREAELASHDLRLANEKLEEQAVELEVQQERLQDQAVEAEEQGEALQNLNEDLRRQRAAADEANHAKSAFLAVMSHELRTPLNAIGGYVQLLEMGLHGPVSEEQKDALGRIDRSQRHLLRLINDILNLSRIEAGKSTTRSRTVELREVVENMTPMIYPQISSKALHLEVDVPVKLMASGDRGENPADNPQSSDQCNQVHFRGRSRPYRGRRRRT